MSASMLDACSSSPSDGQHECMPGEMRCVYCAIRLDPYPCHHCGKFLTAAQMFRVSQGENARCNELDDAEPPADAPGGGR